MRSNLGRKLWAKRGVDPCKDEHRTWKLPVPTGNCPQVPVLCLGVNSEKRWPTDVESSSNTFEAFICSCRKC